MVYMPHWPKKLKIVRSNRNFDAMRKVLEHLGSPHKLLPKIIHVAGTNGKGSTCCMIYDILRKSGFTACLYISPHIEHFNERIQINGNKITDDSLFYYLEKTRIATEEMNIELTFFETITIAAFLAFSESKADFLVLETGMGGRLDPTNIIEKPLLTVITSISYDHMEHLGYDINDIASEKAGIIKKDVPCIIGRQDKKVLDVVLKKCEIMQAPAICYEYDYIAEKNHNGFNFFSRLGDLEIEDFALEGDHQIINASTALAAIKVLSQTIKIEDSTIKKALSKISWPGRLQRIYIKNIFPNNPLEYCWIDGAHNVHGAFTLSNWINEKNFDQILIIIGLTKNRDIESILSQFNSKNIKFMSVSVTAEPDSYSSSNLANIARDKNFDIDDGGTLIEALETAALKYPQYEIIITGSLFLVTELLRITKK